MRKRLMRSSTNRVVAGVCGGLGAYFDADPAFFRIGLSLFTLAGGAGILAYLVCWLCMPRDDAWL